MDISHLLYIFFICIYIKKDWKLPCYNGRFSNSRATEHNQTIAIAGRWFARVLLRGRGRGAGADRDRKDAILRAWGPLQLGARLCTPSPPIDSLLGLLCCASASAQPLRAAHESAARLQLERKSLSININHVSNFSIVGSIQFAYKSAKYISSSADWFPELGSFASFLIYLFSIVVSMIYFHASFPSRKKYRWM